MHFKPDRSLRNFTEANYLLPTTVALVHAAKLTEKCSQLFRELPYGAHSLRFKAVCSLEQLRKAVT